MSNIYLVMGASGQYEDRVQWRVAAYTRRKHATDRVRALTDIVAQVSDWLENHRIKEPYFPTASNEVATDEQAEKWSKWERAISRAGRKYAWRAGDKNLDFESTYWVEKIQLVHAASSIDKIRLVQSR